MKSLALAAAIGLLTTSMATSAPVVRGTHYEEAIYGSCSGTWYCTLFFSATPANKFLTIRYVSCYLMRQYPLTRLTLGVSQTAGQETGGRTIPLALNQSDNISGWYVSSAGQETSILVGPGRYVYIRSDTISNSGGTINCHISGELGD